MAKIFYSMSGEGRGHATRVRAIVDELRQRHEITLFAPGDAYELLEPAYRNSDVKIHRISCLRFYYTAKGKLHRIKTAIGAVRYLRKYWRARGRLDEYIRRHQPDVILTDFEPSLPRAARRTGVPFISLNHQHFLIVNDLAQLPWRLRLHAWFMGLVVGSYYRKQARTIVSSFYFPPLKKKHDDVVQVGVILRPSVIGAARGNEGHLVAYLRKFATPNVIDALRQCGREVRLYGLGDKPPEGNVRYCAISEEHFLRDLATCDALVCTAGNQLVGEALYLGKPVLAMPEANNQEQYINAYFLEQEGTGEWVELQELTPGRIRAFLGRVDAYRQRIVPDKFHGNPVAISAVEDFLETLREQEKDKEVEAAAGRSAT